MKPLHLITTLDTRYGGPVVALAGLCEAQARCRLEVTVVGEQEGDERTSIAKRLIANGVQAHSLKPPLRFLRAPHSAVSQLEEFVVNADIIHIHGLWTEILHQGIRLARIHNKPVVLRPCGMLDPWSLAQSRLKKRLVMQLRQRRDIEGVTAIHFTTDIERDLTRDLNIAVPSIVEPNGVDLSEFETLPPHGSFRSRYPQIKERPVLLFLSRIHPKKGLDLLIPAFAKARVDDAILVIAGPDEEGYRSQVETMVKSHRLEEQVIFTGMLTGAEKVAALTDSDVFVLPSYQENFGVAAIEALAANTPVIISDQVNIHEQIRAAKVGVVVPLRIDVLAQEIKRWMHDSDVRGEARVRALDFVRRNYDWNTIAWRWTGHYAQLLSRSQII